MTDVVLASTKTLRTLADGGMTVTLDIAPEHFEAAFRLFGKAGSTVGVAAITPEASRKATQQAQQAREEEVADDLATIGSTVLMRQSFTALPRMKQAGIRCREPAFWAYLTERFCDHLGGQPVVDTDGAANVIRWHCLVVSRRTLDESAGAAALWDALEADYYAKQHGMR